MKLIVNIASSVYVLICLLYFLAFQTLNAAKANENKNSTKVVDKEFLNHINFMKKQMIREGSEFKNVALKFISKTNRYVIADENIEKNSTIIRIPFKKLITVKNPLVEQFCASLGLEEFSSAGKIFGDQFNCLIVFMFFQLRKPDPSLKSYVESIPKNFLEYPHFFMEAEHSKLNNSFMLNNYNSEIQKIETISNLIKKANLKNFDNKNFTFAEVKHAYLSVASRNFWITLKNENKTYHVLAPYTDMFNFDPKSNTVWLGKLNDENDFFLLRATKDIKKGSQIFVFYGEDDNSALLFGYGFTLENNPFQPSNDFFIYKHKGRNYNANLRMNETNNLIQIVEDYRKENKTKFNLKKDKAETKNFDLEVFKSVLESLKRYSNKGRIEEYKNNSKKNPNYRNIYRVLMTEDALIDKNLQYLAEIIEILEGGKQKLNEKSKSQVVVQNLNYFENLLL